jgi:hypothetical protein
MNGFVKRIVKTNFVSKYRATVYDQSWDPDRLLLKIPGQDPAKRYGSDRIWISRSTSAVPCRYSIFLFYFLRIFYIEIKTAATVTAYGM